MRSGVGARIRVRKSRVPGGWVWRCTRCPDIPILERNSTLWSQALAAGLEHLGVWHGSAWPSGQVQVTSRCTCGDGPQLTYPHFRPCPVHAHLVNPGSTSRTLQAYVSSDLRRQRDDLAPGDPEGLSGPQNAAHEVGGER